MIVDLSINVLWFWTTSNEFVAGASLIDNVAQVQVTEEVHVNDNSALEENLRRLA